MRPIDADALKKKAFSIEADYPDDSYTFRVVYESDIENAPTLARPVATVIACNPLCYDTVALRCNCKCSNCSAPINENMKWCYECGNKLEILHGRCY